MVMEENGEGGNTQQQQELQQEGEGREGRGVADGNTNTPYETNKQTHKQFT